MFDMLDAYLLQDDSSFRTVKSVLQNSIIQYLNFVLEARSTMIVSLVYGYEGEEPSVVKMSVPVFPHNNYF